MIAVGLSNEAQQQLRNKPYIVGVRKLTRNLINYILVSLCSPWLLLLTKLQANIHAAQISRFLF